MAIKISWTAAISFAAIALLSLGATAATSSLPRETVVPVSEVTKYFPDVTVVAGTGPNETTVGEPIALLSVIFTSADGKKKVTLSVDKYASADEAKVAYDTAVEGSKVAPGFKPAESPSLGQADAPFVARRAFYLGTPKAIAVSNAAQAFCNLIKGKFLEAGVERFQRYPATGKSSALAPR